MASAEGKTVVASMIVEDIKFHTINPVAMNGKKSFIGVLNKLPNIRPIQATITAVEIVIQNGPSDDLLYLCVISTLAKYRGRFKFRTAKSTSEMPILFKFIF